MELVLGLFMVLIAALIGGFLARIFKLPSVVGYIVAGIFFGAVLPENVKNISMLAGLGTILLLFSIGLELSFTGLSRYLNIAVFGAMAQMIVVTLVSFFILKFFGIFQNASIILSLGFSVSSTAVLVKILGDKGEMDTIHGQIMFGWSLIQDLTVIPIMVLMPVIWAGGASWLNIATISLSKAFLVVAAAVVLGKIIIPKLIHVLASANSRELLLLASISLALGTAFAASLLGVSPALGAFLAGLVISGSQEHHAIFAETRPLRDLFVALFFVSLGFLVSPAVFVSRFGLILLIAGSIIVLKAIVVFVLSAVFGYSGRTAISASLGLAQVGEFAFVIFSSALALGLINNQDIMLGISVTLVTLIVSPILFDAAVPIWHKLRKYRIFSSGEKKLFSLDVDLKDHIIICGYGRVGKWIGKSLKELAIPFVVVDYNQKVVQDLKDAGISVIYGDPTEPEVMEVVGIRNAKAVILAIPDRVVQETLIAYVQTVAPDVKIISRAHMDEDWDKLKTLRVDKIVQPEFEAAVEIVRSVLTGRGKSKMEVSEALTSLRASHSH